MNDDRIADITIIGVYITIIILRLCNVINWAWHWILLPIWLPIALTLAAVPIAVVLIIIIKINNLITRYKNERY